jgi:hypothetical protein
MLNKTIGNSLQPHSPTNTADSKDHTLLQRHPQGKYTRQQRSKGRRMKAQRNPLLYIIYIYICVCAYRERKREKNERPADRDRTISRQRESE